MAKRAPARHPARTRAKTAAVSPGDPVVRAFYQAVASAAFRKRAAVLTAQALRLGKLLAIQQSTPQKEFPPGCCFLHANVPTTTSFCVRRLVEVDLDACSATIEIHADEDLEAGHVVLPLEALGWYGFPTRAVSVGVRFHGFE